MVFREFVKRNVLVFAAGGVPTFDRGEFRVEIDLSLVRLGLCHFFDEPLVEGGNPVDAGSLRDFFPVKPLFVAEDGDECRLLDALSLVGGEGAAGHRGHERVRGRGDLCGMSEGGGGLADLAGVKQFPCAAGGFSAEEFPCAGDGFLRGDVAFEFLANGGELARQVLLAAREDHGSGKADQPVVSGRHPLGVVPEGEPRPQRVARNSAAFGLAFGRGVWWSLPSSFKNDFKRG